VSARDRRLVVTRFACLVGLSLATAVASEEPLPSAVSIKESFARRMTASQREKEDFEKRYQYAHTRVREERNAKGKLRKRTKEEHLHDPRQPASRSGKKGGGGRYGEHDIVIDGELLDRFTFQVEGREQLDGRDVLRVTFRPVSPDLPKHNTLDRFVNRTAGTLWLEESTLILLKAQMRLLEKVSFLGGVAGVVYRLDMTFVRSPTPEGVWYTRRGAWQVDYRAFLRRKVVQFEERREEVACVRPGEASTRDLQ
jgi:hypothetical protein